MSPNVINCRKKYQNRSRNKEIEKQIKGVRNWSDRKRHAKETDTTMS